MGGMHSRRSVLVVFPMCINCLLKSELYYACLPLYLYLRTSSLLFLFLSFSLPSFLAHLIVLIPDASTSQVWVLVEKRSPRLVAIYPHLDILDIIWLSKFLTVLLEYVRSHFGRTAPWLYRVICWHPTAYLTLQQVIEWMGSLSLVAIHTHTHTHSTPRTPHDFLRLHSISFITVHTHPVYGIFLRSITFYWFWSGLSVNDVPFISRQDMWNICRCSCLEKLFLQPRCLH